MFIVVSRTVRIVPQARARNVERFGRYRKTLEPGMNFIVPIVDRVKPLIDLREQVVAFRGQPVITEDNLVVSIDTVLFFQVTDPRAADYEIVNYIQAIEQITATMLRSVIGNMDLEETLTSRDKINTMLRSVLDDASGKWGLRVTRVEIKAIDPPKSVIDAMEKQHLAGGAPRHDQPGLRVHDLHLDVRVHPAHGGHPPLHVVVGPGLRRHRGRLGHPVADRHLGHVHLAHHPLHHLHRAGEPAMMPVRSEDRSYSAKSGRASSAMNMVGTP